MGPRVVNRSQAIATDPDQKPAWFMRGDLLMKQKKEREAVASYRGAFLRVLACWLHCI